MELLKPRFFKLTNLLLVLSLGASNGAASVMPRGEPKGPSFAPPPNTDSPLQVIQCEYPSMKGYEHSTTNKTGWLKWVGPGDEPEVKNYDVGTDYEAYTPVGITRKYSLEVSNHTVNLDGVDFNQAKLFNGEYPGPWIQACWGDTIEITVKNNLQYNGTSVHMHGIRMENTNLMDGVPGVTQCPIAPGDSFTYKFVAKQYGTTWYHSHYSLQYADGMLGPLTIHGPASADYDESIDPILMSDHSHTSAFQEYHHRMGGGRAPPMKSQLLNGKGTYAQDEKWDRYSTLVESGKKYLLRLINTASETTWIFSIDGHKFKVINADLVPLVPYETDHVVVGLGQRYHVILDTLPDVKDGESFWIRMTPAKGCSNFEKTQDDKMGILYYGEKSDSLPSPSVVDFDPQCRDEPYDSLKPLHPWTVPDPGLDSALFKNPQQVATGVFTPPDRPDDVQIATWAVGPQTMWLNYSRPIVKHLDDDKWPETWAVYESEEYTYNKWIYLVITGNDDPTLRARVPVAHPIHFHGHDFALLQQSKEPYHVSKLNLKLDNPPRRDVVLLPANGFVVIAFEADNPGAWLMHCHIAGHVSQGFALQILERKNDFIKYLDAHESEVQEMNRVCDKWDEWFEDKDNHYPGEEYFQDDSGV